MYLVKSLAVALSMYSKIPVPAVEWKEENMKYAMCFFPVVGVAAGALQYLAAAVLLGFTGLRDCPFFCRDDFDSGPCNRRNSSGRVCRHHGRPCLLGKQGEKAGDSERSPHRRFCRDRSVLLVPFYLCSVE